MVAQLNRTTEGKPNTGFRLPTSHAFVSASAWRRVSSLSSRSASAPARYAARAFTRDGLQRRHGTQTLPESDTHRRGSRNRTCGWVRRRP